MVLTAHQPVYLPWLGLFHKIALADRFVSFNQVQYQPKNYNNRNRIKTSSSLMWLTVPTKRKGYLEKKICEIEINNEVPWGRKHWRTLVACYGKSRFFSKYSSFFEDVYSREWLTLINLNEYMLQWFLNTLKINVRVESAGDFNFTGKKSAVVLDMCKQLSAQVYIFGANGKDYADVDSFQVNNIRVEFQNYRHPVYRQLYSGFESHLSIIDLLFNCGEDSLDIIMDDNIEKSDILKHL